MGINAIVMPKLPNGEPSQPTAIYAGILVRISLWYIQDAIIGPLASEFVAYARTRASKTYQAGFFMSSLAAYDIGRSLNH